MPSLTAIVARLAVLAPSLVPSHAGCASDRTATRLLAAPDHEAWLLSWTPGSSVEPHDHGDAAGAFVVVSGSLTEVRWLDGRRVITEVGPGEVVAVPRGVVHDVIASTSAVSIHVYAPVLSTMGFYDADGRTCVEVRAVESEAPILVDVAQVRVASSADRDRVATAAAV